ncbi:MAG TPA: ABC transporter permease [bacterium]|nr:ABC transporter permease [bacterium]
MTRYIVRRLLLMVPTLFGVTVVVFTFIHLLPGDPAALMAGNDATGEAIAIMQHELGLDRPLWTQYGIYVSELLRGNLGVSLRDHDPVSAHVGQAFGPTLVLTVCAMVVAITVGLTIGVMAAVNHNRFPDYAGTSLAMFGISLPSFVLGLALIWVFAVELRWFPTGGYHGPSTLVLPAITLGMGAGATIERIARSQMLEALGQDYVRTAKAKGQRTSVIVVRHVLRNALIPVVTVAGLDFGNLISGAIIVESIFAYPGLGRLLFDSINFRDYPQIQGIVFTFAAEFLMVNLLTDLLYARVDPRIRYR